MYSGSLCSRAVLALLRERDLPVHLDPFAGPDTSEVAGEDLGTSAPQDFLVVPQMLDPKTQPPATGGWGYPAHDYHFAGLEGHQLR